MRNYVTLFDKSYLSRGLALYESLKNTCEADFTLYILVLDQETNDYLAGKNYKNIKIEALEELSLAYPVLKRLRKERTWGEFCWTLSAFSIQYTITANGLDDCTYIDSDLYFYARPEYLFRGIKDRSVMITAHDYYPRYDQSETSGKFCVQFMYFKNDEKGMQVLEWWRSRCEEWCFNRFEDGKFGDQKYLDDWENRFGDTVYVCEETGSFLAPWNCQKYKIYTKGENYYAQNRITKIERPLIFWHFHKLLKLNDGSWIMSNYQLTDEARKLYEDYIELLKKIDEGLLLNLRSIGIDNPYIIKHRFIFSLRMAWHTFKEELFGKKEYEYNIYR